MAFRNICCGGLSSDRTTITLCQIKFSGFTQTRAPHGTAFRERLQPLHQRVDALRALLDRLMVSHDIVKVGQSDEHSAHLIAMKTNGPPRGGPHAFLIRAAIIQRLAVNHDFLAAPEAVVDLARVMAGANASALLNVYRESSVPCIVKFVSRDPRDDVTPVALLYCYLAIKRKPPGIFGNTCFNGAGVPVPYDDLVSVEFLPQNRS